MLLRAVITNSLIVSISSCKYEMLMKNVASSPTAKRLTALIMGLALMIAGMTATVAMDHTGHKGAANAVSWAPSDSKVMGHEAHHMPSGEAEAECCESETTAASSCHVVACCLSELQYSDLPVTSENERSACTKAMMSIAFRSIAISLPERPPRLS